MPRADGQSAPAPFPAQRPPRPVYQGGDRGPRYGVPAAGPRLANREGEPPRPPVQRERRTEARGDSRADGYSRNSTSRRQSATESTENP